EMQKNYLRDCLRDTFGHGEFGTTLKIIWPYQPNQSDLDFQYVRLWESLFSLEQDREIKVLDFTVQEAVTATVRLVEENISSTKTVTLASKHLLLRGNGLFYGEERLLA